MEVDLLDDDDIDEESLVCANCHGINLASREDIARQSYLVTDELYQDLFGEHPRGKQPKRNEIVLYQEDVGDNPEYIVAQERMRSSRGERWWETANFRFGADTSSQIEYQMFQKAVGQAFTYAQNLPVERLDDLIARMSEELPAYGSDTADIIDVILAVDARASTPAVRTYLVAVFEEFVSAHESEEVIRMIGILVQHYGWSDEKQITKGIRDMLGISQHIVHDDLLEAAIDEILKTRP